jgi:hypothetical protein
MHRITKLRRMLQLSYATFSIGFDILSPKASLFVMPRLSGMPQFAARLLGNAEFRTYGI